MIIISYDIADDKTRRHFSKYLLKFGHRLQYSVYEIDNGPRVLDGIIADIEGRFKKKFTEEDTVLIMKLSKSCDIKRYGYAVNDEDDLLII